MQIYASLFLLSIAHMSFSSQLLTAPLFIYILIYILHVIHMVYIAFTITAIYQYSWLKLPSIRITRPASSYRSYRRAEFHGLHGLHSTPLIYYIWFLSYSRFFCWRHWPSLRIRMLHRNIFPLQWFSEFDRHYAISFSYTELALIFYEHWFADRISRALMPMTLFHHLL